VAQRPLQAGAELGLTRARTRARSEISTTGPCGRLFERNAAALLDEVTALTREETLRDPYDMRP
jgi:hypothetical protein